MVKPIVRWTVTDVSEWGFEVLNKSVVLFNSLYGDRFETFICYNNLSKSNFSKLPKVDNLLDQSKFSGSLPIKAPDHYCCAWKIYPPRININVQEIFLDNDVILYKKIPQFDEDKIVITEAINRSYSGPLAGKIKTNLNVGLMSFPPNFDLFSKICNVVKVMPLEWKEYFDEQTLLAYIIEKHDHHVLTLKDVHICLNNFSYGKYCLFLKSDNK
ncbi:MAG: hypothetical protein WCG45_03600 [bacterium]